MKNKENIEYTYKHRKVVMYLAKKYFNDNKELLEQIKLHDLDKLYIYLFYNKSEVSKIHKNNISHHKNEVEKTKLDYIEMVLDWESARYTKPDKPLNAYDTLYAYFPDMENEILPILKELKLDKPNSDMEKDVLEYANSLNSITINEIKEEMKKYLDIII